MGSQWSSFCCVVKMIHVLTGCCSAPAPGTGAGGTSQCVRTTWQPLLSSTAGCWGERGIATPLLESAAPSCSAAVLQRIWSLFCAHCFPCKVLTRQELCSLPRSLSLEHSVMLSGSSLGSSLPFPALQGKYGCHCCSWVNSCAPKMAPCGPEWMKALEHRGHRSLKPHQTACCLHWSGVSWKKASS